MTEHLKALHARGVIIHCPQSVYFGPEVDPKRFAEGVVIHAGCRFHGAETSIGPESIVGAEAPVTIKNCRLGRGVALKGGYFDGAVFLDGSNMGSGAHIRGGTILEEQANGAHTVGLKQTILHPFVTLGSLINFCDVMMAGGTSRKNHSEVGSSYIHFNFTGQQDKATASLIGDVPRGVLLDQSAIFLGGQGGLVGPVRIEYGCVTGAGSVCRKDLPKPNQVYVPDVKPVNRDIPGPVYFKIERKLQCNLAYIGNLYALKAWYQTVRSLFMKRDAFDEACYEGALKNLDSAIKERLKRLDAFVGKLETSIGLLKEMSIDVTECVTQQERLLEEWPGMKQRCSTALTGDEAARDRFLDTLGNVADDQNYIETIQGLAADQKKDVVTWLQSIVDTITG